MLWVWARRCWAPQCHHSDIPGTLTGWRLNKYLVRDRGDCLQILTYSDLSRGAQPGLRSHQEMPEANVSISSIPQHDILTGYDHSGGFFPHSLGQSENNYIMPSFMRGMPGWENLGLERLSHFPAVTGLGGRTRIPVQVGLLSGPLSGHEDKVCRGGWPSSKLSLPHKHRCLL